MADLKTEMQRLYPPLPECPPNHKFGTVAELYSDYMSKLASDPIKDPLGKLVAFMPENFPHLIKLEFLNRKTKSWTDAAAIPTLQHLRAGTFDEARHRISDPSRPRTLFWVPDVLSSPDAIYDNKKKGMDVYLKRFRRSAGPTLKIALVASRPNDGSVVVTSFWTDESYLSTCTRGAPKHGALIVKATR